MKVTAAPVEGAWSSGLFACFSDWDSCCLALWCTCISIGRIAEIVDKGSTRCKDAGCAYMYLMACTGCHHFYSRKYRTKMREEYGIPGNKCWDCLLIRFCEVCVIAQMYRELTARGFHPALGWDGNLAKQNQGVATTAPVAPGGMSR